jgi:hypothetical protein
MQSLNINVSKIDKSALHDGAKGKYLNLTLLDNREGTDQYGNDGMIVQDLGKDRRLAGEKGPILGNWKHIGTREDLRGPAPVKAASPQASTQTAAEWEADDDIPF